MVKMEALGPCIDMFLIIKTVIEYNSICSLQFKDLIKDAFSTNQISIQRRYSAIPPFQLILL